MGQGVIQWAHISGFSTIVTTASVSNASFLKSLGATDVVGRGSAAAEEIKAFLPGGATGVLFDSITNEETQKLGIAVTKSDAQIILTLPAQPGLDAEGTRRIFNIFGLIEHNKEFAADLWKALPEYLESGELKVSCGNTERLFDF